MPIDPAERDVEVPGDTGAADLVAPTGEEMPVATHDEVGNQPEGGAGADPTAGIAPHSDSAGADGKPVRDHRTTPAGAGQRTLP